MRTDGFINVLNGDRVAFKFAGRDGAAVENKSGNIEAGQRHDATGNGLVAADQNHQRVKKISAGHQFDGVGNDFAADQRSLHSFGAHGDVVGDGNGIEFERCAASFADAGFHVFGKFAQVIVAGADFDP